MIDLRLNQVSKRFRTNWIFRKIDLSVDHGDALFVNGPNGSGKSTLLKTMSGWVSPNEGTIDYISAKGNILVDDIYQYLSICAPYLDLVEEFTLTETLNFHQSFKPLEQHADSKAFADAIEINYDAEKPLKEYSSGMKQRVKLGLALFSNSDLILLDEPTSNLDKNGINWYKNEITKLVSKRTLIVCSNDIEAEHFFCTKKINLSDYK